MGILSIGLGAVLMILTIPTFTDGGWLNGIVGALAVGIGLLILKSVRLYAMRHHISTTTHIDT